MAIPPRKGTKINAISFPYNNLGVFIKKRVPRYRGDTNAKKVDTRGREGGYSRASSEDKIFPFRA